MLISLAGCVDNPTIKFHGPPPKDPPDYHGVPTDTRPPMMLDDQAPSQ
ncbi:hypothetical protein [Burkholderia sp. WAC0059]|nr:hypothetical protein [Burkholderia sp. WAC0059]